MRQPVGRQLIRDAGAVLLDATADADLPLLFGSALKPGPTGFPTSICGGLGRRVAHAQPCHCRGGSLHRTLSRQHGPSGARGDQSFIDAGFGQRTAGAALPPKNECSTVQGKGAPQRTGTCELRRFRARMRKGARRRPAELWRSWNYAVLLRLTMMRPASALAMRGRAPGTGTGARIRFSAV